MYLSRLEASVIVRDMCLADNAISARKDSTIYNSQTLMAAVLVTVIPLGQSMEILPVTKIQASASAKQMLLVCVMQEFGAIFLISGSKKNTWFLNEKCSKLLCWRQILRMNKINCWKIINLTILWNYSLKFSLINPLEVSLWYSCISLHSSILIRHRNNVICLLHRCFF